MKTDIKEYITDALFELLKNKDINNIKIVELVKLSGLSRTTFYNNFKNLDDVLNYKIENISIDIKRLIKLNKLRNKDLKSLLIEILNYINANKNIFIIIRKKFFFKLKDNIDKNINNNYDYYIKSGIIINLCIFYIDNNFQINIDKIKID